MSFIYIILCGLLIGSFMVMPGVSGLVIAVILGLYEKIISSAKKSGAQVVGPVPLPTEKEVYTILRAVHKYKDSREQFEIRTHKRLIDIVNPTPETVDVLTRLELPSGVDIEIKL